MLVCCIVKTALISETFKAKLRLYIDENELQNIITSHIVLALKAIAAELK